MSALESSHPDELFSHRCCFVWATEADEEGGDESDNLSVAATDEITEVTLHSIPSVDADTSSVAPPPRDGARAPEPEPLPETGPETTSMSEITSSTPEILAEEKKASAPEAEDAVIEALEKEEEEEEEMTEEEWKKKEEELKQWVNTVRNVALHETGTTLLFKMKRC